MLNSFFLQLERLRVYAVSQISRLWSIREDMTKVCATFVASYFGANHAVAVVVFFFDVFCFERLVEARPATAGVEFCIGTEQLSAAANAFVSAFVMAVVVFTCEGALGALLASNPILLGSELLFPLFFGFDYLIAHFSLPFYGFISGRFHRRAEVFDAGHASGFCSRLGGWFIG